MGIIGTGGVTIINNGSASTNPDGSNTPVYFADCATTLALPACTYNNGTLGVGATLTANANGALTTTYTDGVALSIGDIILVWQQTSKLQNGLYEITQIGTVSTPWILTRLAIYDTTAEVYPSQVNILYGTVYATKYFLQQTENPTIGTSSLVYVTVTAPSSSTINQYLQLVDTYTISALPTCTYTPNASATTPALNAYLNATVNGAFPTLNGVAPFQYMKVLVTGQADPKQNGDYKLQNVGSASSTWRLSRISYTAPQLYPTWWGIYQGTGRGLIFEQTTSTLTTATIGVSGNIVFVQAVSSPTTIYTGDGTLSGARTVTMAGNQLSFIGANNRLAILGNGTGTSFLQVTNGSSGTTSGDGMLIGYDTDGEAYIKCQDGNQLILANSTGNALVATATNISIPNRMIIGAPVSSLGTGAQLQVISSGITSATIPIFVTGLASSRYHIFNGAGDVSIGADSTTISARLQIKGSGTTSATKGLSVQNSAGTELVVSKNDGTFELNVGTGFGNLVFTSNGGINRTGVFGYNLRVGVDSSKCLSFAGGEGLIGTYNHSGTNTFANGSGTTDAYISLQLANQFTTWFYARNGKNMYMTDSSSNYILGVSNTFWMQSGTAPTSGIVDHAVFYVNDQTAGNACLHTRTENGAIVKLYQETTAVASGTLVSNAGTTLTSTDTIDGYTLQQVVKALRNLGILA